MHVVNDFMHAARRVWRFVPDDHLPVRRPARQPVEVAFEFVLSWFRVLGSPPALREKWGEFVVERFGTRDFPAALRLQVAVNPQAVVVGQVAGSQQQVVGGEPQLLEGERQLPGLIEDGHRGGHAVQRKILRHEVRILAGDVVGAGDEAVISRPGAEKPVPLAAGEVRVDAQPVAEVGENLFDVGNGVGQHREGGFRREFGSALGVHDFGSVLFFNAEILTFT